MFKKVEGRMHEHIKQKRERYKKKVPKKAPRGKQKNEMINILDGNNSRLHTADQFLKTKQQELAKMKQKRLEKQWPEAQV